MRGLRGIWSDFIGIELLTHRRVEPLNVPEQMSAMGH